jgi:hypothetical protein
VKGTLNMIVWTKFKFAAGLAGLLLLVLGGGTATVVAQKAAQSRSAVSKEALRSTPVGALRYLLDAFAAYDGEKIVDSHVTNSLPMQRMVVAISAAVSAEGRLRRALEDKFQNAGGLGRGPAVQMGFNHEQLDSAEEKITGNTATVTISNPEEVQHFVRVGKIWKITDPDGGATLANVESKASRLEAAGRIYDEIADAVTQGRFQSSAEATAVLRKKLLAEMKNK